MRTLLINAPVQRTSEHARLSPPLGLAYVAAATRGAGHPVDLVDLNLSRTTERTLAAALDRFRPQVVGISAHTETYPNALRIARQVKAFDQRVVVVMGGPHASIVPEQVVSQADVDFAVVGEGERTFVELIQGLEAGRSGFPGVDGLAWSQGGGAVVNPRRAPMHADDVGLPARDLLALEFYENAFNVLTARGGCPYRCPFCSASQIWSGMHRQRSVVAVVDEIELLVREYGARSVFFVDDILTLDRKWTLHLLAEMQRLHGAVTWGCATRVDRVDEELLGLMAAAGCTGVQFGIESGAQEILDSVKGIEKDQALDAVRWAVAAGIRPGASFMVPLPDDTSESLAQTFEFMRTLQDEGAELMMSYTAPFPGTAFYERADELGLRVLSDDWERFDAKHVVMETSALDARTIERVVATQMARLGLERTDT